MTKALRNALMLVFSLMISGTLIMAQATDKKTDKDTSKEHHSPFSKAAFWRHHKDSNQKPKTATAQPASKSAQSQSAQVKPAKQSSPKQSAKPVAAKQVSAKQNQKPEQGTQHATKGSAKKSAAASKTKAQKKSTEPKVVSMQQ